MTGVKYSGGAVLIQQLALMDAVGRPFDRDRSRMGLRPDRHDQQHIRTATGRNRARNKRRGRTIATAQRMGDPWHIYPELAAAACGRRRPISRSSRSKRSCRCWDDRIACCSRPRCRRW